MKTIAKHLFGQVLCLYLASIASAACDLRAAAGGSSFVVFDGTLYLKKPSLATQGIRDVRIIYEGELWRGGANRNDVPPVEDIARALERIPDENAIVVLDVEQWPVAGDQGQVQASISKLAELARRVKAVRKGCVGYYGIMPNRDYWRAVKSPQSEDRRKWHAENDALKALVDSVDVLFPSLYTFYPDERGWVEYAKANLSEARRIAGGRPVIAFLWPQYHDSNRTLRDKYIAPTFWKRQLDTVGGLADGAVIWGGFQQTWDDSAPWWTTTLQWLTERNAAAARP